MTCSQPCLVFIWHFLSHTQLHRPLPWFLTSLPSLVSRWLVLLYSFWLFLFAWSLSASAVAMPTDKASTSRRRTRQQILPPCSAIVHHCGPSHLRQLSLSLMERASLLKRKMSSTFSPLFNDKLFSYILITTYVHVHLISHRYMQTLSLNFSISKYFLQEMYSAYVHLKDIGTPTFTM